MKRKALAALFAALVSSLVVTLPAAAQDGVIALNDATPGLDVVVSLPPQTTGAVSLELDHASVSITDSAGNAVFQMADPRATALELRFAPNTGPFTLSVSRLPGVTEAHVIINSLPDLTNTGTSTVSTNGIVGPAQNLDLSLGSSRPGGSVPVIIPNGSNGIITMTFPGAPVTAQLVDETGAPIATLYGGSADGISVAMPAGNYQVALLDGDPNTSAVANVSLMPEQSGGLGTVLASYVASQPSTSTVASNNGASPDLSQNCLAQITASSVNMRSGPGTGYSVLGFGFRGETFYVGGTNPDQSWLLIGAGDGESAWISGQTAQTAGACMNLTVYNIPFRDAPQPVAGSSNSNDSVFVQPAQQAPVISSAPSFGGESEGGEHGGHDD